MDSLEKKKTARYAWRIALAAAGAALVVCGLAWGGWHSVLSRAALVCMECIGLG